MLQFLREEEEEDDEEFISLLDKDDECNVPTHSCILALKIIHFCELSGPSLFDPLQAKLKG